MRQNNANAGKTGFRNETSVKSTQNTCVQVVSRKAGVSPFRFRVNALEYQNLQDRLSGPIQNLRNIQIYRTVSERFVDVFKVQK